MMTLETKKKAGRRNPHKVKREMKNVKFWIGGFRCVTVADTSISHGRYFSKALVATIFNAAIPAHMTGICQPHASHIARHPRAMMKENKNPQTFLPSQVRLH